MKPILIFIVTFFSVFYFGCNKNEPKVEKTDKGTYVLVLNDAQKNTIVQFLKNHPQLKLVTPEEFPPDSDIINLINKGEEQYPYTCWGDFNKDGYLDLCALFVTREKHGYYYTWWVILFNGTKTGELKPEIISNSIVNSFAPGIIYYPKDNHIEFFYYGKAAGSFHWDEQKLEYVIENPQMMGD